MNFADAEVAIRAHIEAGFTLGGFHLAWENEDWIRGNSNFVYIAIEGVFSEKSIYGSVGQRSSVEHGIVFIHTFTKKGTGKAAALSCIIELTKLLELQTIAEVIDMDGGAPPSPVEDDSDLVGSRPTGNYYRCSGSVPFIVRSGI